MFWCWVAGKTCTVGCREATLPVLCARVAGRRRQTTLPSVGCTMCRYHHDPKRRVLSAQHMYAPCLMRLANSRHLVSRMRSSGRWSLLKWSPGPSRPRERTSRLRIQVPCLYTMVFGRLHIGASALTSGGGSASENGWQASVAGTGECRKIVFDV